ncbi:PREDICTED: uncharacterized protein LOC109339159 [Lupinus angustifolius]|uniref:uncharacterized protein LOC109339159 n=1 Tax=Lupinus angustifolius TaxID=3871 RepID=UPI00092F3615|nr:PREDICTED: uncharacterized protein LOC109339159 [Lupinus angustifolius]
MGYGSFDKLFPDVALSIAKTTRSNGLDKLVWKHAEDGMLSLKAAYSLVSKSSNNLIWCKQVWSQVIPPSNTFITWRIIHGKMPLDKNLQRRGCVLASRCSIFKQVIEDTNHIFLNYNFSINLWNWLMWIFSIKLNLNFIKDLVLSCRNQFSRQLQEVLLICVVHKISTIWFCKSQNRFQDIGVSLNLAISRIKRDTSLSGNYSLASASPTIKDLSILKQFKITVNYNKAPKITKVTWMPPSLGWVKVNIDGATFGYPGHVGGDGIFRDHNGVFLHGFGFYLNNQNALYIELHSTIKAIKMAYKKGWLNLWLEVDSILVLQIFKGNSKPPWKLLNDWHRCKKFLDSMNYKITHIYREGNICADKLASFGAKSRTIAPGIEITHIHS